MKVKLDRFFYLEKYFDQGRTASRRKIEFLITFDEWLKIWIDSGHLNNRGVKKGQYVMARNGDTGPYVTSNVSIIPHTQNCSDVWKNKGTQIRLKQSIRKRGQPAYNKGIPHTAEARAKISVSNTGKKCPYNTERARQMGFRNKGKKHSIETINKRIKAILGSKRSPETRAKMSIARTIYWANKHSNTVTT